MRDLFNWPSFVRRCSLLDSLQYGYKLFKKMNLLKWHEQRERQREKNTVAAYSMESSMLSIRYAFRIDSIRMKEIFFSCGFFDNTFNFFWFFLFFLSIYLGVHFVFNFVVCLCFVAVSHIWNARPNVCAVLILHTMHRVTPNYFSSAAICAANQRFFFSVVLLMSECDFYSFVHCSI